VVGEDNGYQADVATFELVPAESLQIRSRIHIDLAIGVSEGVLQLLFQLHPVLLQISVHHLESLLDGLRPVVLECRDNIFSCRVSPGARGEAFLHLDEFGDVPSSEDWGAHGAREWHLLLFHRDDEGYGPNDLPLVVCMIGGGVGRRSTAGGGTGLA